MAKTNFKDIDDYISTFPDDVRVRLNEMRQIIHKAAPEAQESISYQIPVFKQNGYVGYFAGFKNHVSFYPIPHVNGAFMEEMAPYVHGKGTLRFPLDKPLPADLITKTVKFWQNRNLEKKK